MSKKITKKLIQNKANKTNMEKSQLNIFQCQFNVRIEEP